MSYFDPIPDEWFTYQEKVCGTKQSTLRSVHSYLFSPRLSDEEAGKRHYLAYKAIKGDRPLEGSITEDSLMHYVVVSRNLKNWKLKIDN